MLGMDQARLAERAEVDPKTVRSLEKGERWPREASRSKIEDALGLPSGTLNRWKARPVSQCDGRQSGARMVATTSSPSAPQHATCEVCGSPAVAVLAPTRERPTTLCAFHLARAAVNLLAQQAIDE
ncbi:helix-turn-helix domain-containing protein [Nocardia asiatica]